MPFPRRKQDEQGRLTEAELDLLGSNYTADHTWIHRLIAEVREHRAAEVPKPAAPDQRIATAALRAAESVDGPARTALEALARELS